MIQMLDANLIEVSQIEPNKLFIIVTLQHHFSRDLKLMLKLYLTERSSLPVIARGLVGWTARAHSSPSQ